MHRLPRGLLVPVALLLATGCSHPWYLVESTYVQPSEHFGEPEVVATPSYRKRGGGARAVALRAPDRCANLSATGSSTSSGELVRTTCGVEMAELERALARSGYRVVSWNAVRAKVLHGVGVTPLEATRSLNADTLFQVNSLERARVGAGITDRWRRTFFESDPSGRKGPKAEVPEARAGALEAHMRDLESEARPVDRYSVTIDVTAVDAASGESIWFYSATRVFGADPDEAEPLTVRQLFECHRRHLQRCLLRYPKAAAKVVAGARSGPPGSRTRGASPAVSPPAAAAPRVATPTRSGSEARALTSEELDAVSRAAYLALLRETMDDLVTEFAAGRP